MKLEWDNTTITRVQIRRKVSAAVLVVDDFTGRPVMAADLKVTAAELTARPIRKPDGYHIFMDCTEPVLTITASMWAYHPATVSVTLAELPALRPVLKIRLTPNRNYSIPNQTTCLEGMGKAGTKIRIICDNDPRPMRLLYDYQPEEENGRLIRIYDPAQSDLEGRQFCLLPKGEDTPIFFAVRETREEGCCVMEESLKKAYKKAGATILPVMTAEADQSGSFFLPFPVLALQEYQCRVFWEAGKGKWKQQPLVMEKGRLNKLDLRG